MKQVHILTPYELANYIIDRDAYYENLEFGDKTMKRPELPPLIDIPDEKEIEEYVDQNGAKVKSIISVSCDAGFLAGANYILTKLNLK